MSIWEYERRQKIEDQHPAAASKSKLLLELIIAILFTIAVAAPIVITVWAHP